MRHLLTTFICTVLLGLAVPAGAQQPAKGKAKDPKAKGTPAGTMKGVYALASVQVNVDGRDTAMNVQQWKIYTDRHYMWARALPNDSLGNFGVGTYRVQKGKVIEYALYTADGGTRRDTFELAITRRPGGFRQVIHFPPDSTGRSSIETEEYRSRGSNVASPLDGAWKMTRMIEYRNGEDSVVNNNPLQFKVYQSGHYIWANQYTDSATQKLVSAFGYGTFRMSGPRQSVETTTNSTYRTGLVGRPVTLQLEFRGRDSYRQTIVWPEVRLVEVYERLK